MTVPTVPEAAVGAACWSCSSSVDATDRYCRRCGAGQGAYLPWYYQAWGLGLLAMLAMGPLVLPMVWKSPVLSRRGKWIFTALLGLMTVWLVKGLYNLVQTVNNVLGSQVSGIQLP